MVCAIATSSITKLKSLMLPKQQPSSQTATSRSVLPDKIDLIDEAGSRPSSELAAAPSAVKELKQELRQLPKIKRRQLRLRILIRLESYDRELKLKPNCASPKPKMRLKRSELPVVDVEDIKSLPLGLECLSTS